MTLPSQPLPTISEANSAADPKVRAALSELQSILSGNVDLTNIATALLQMATGGDRKVNVGTSATASFAGTNQANGSFAHGLGSTPTFWVASFATVSVSGFNRIIVASETGKDVTNVTFVAGTIDAIGLPGAVNFSWMAVA